MGLNLASVVGMASNNRRIVFTRAFGAGAGWRKGTGVKKEGSMEPAEKTPCLAKALVSGQPRRGSPR